MVVDSSALIAAVYGEPEAVIFVQAITSAVAPVMSACNWLETAINVDNHRNPAIRERLDAFRAKLGIAIVPVTEEIAHQARLAYQRYGRGHHRAALNFGDCFAYATARVLGQPLLFKGDDFTHTDIVPALPVKRETRN